jgi:hypothetical protein
MKTKLLAILIVSCVSSSTYGGVKDIIWYEGNRTAIAQAFFKDNDEQVLYQNDLSVRDDANYTIPERIFKYQMSDVPLSTKMEDYIADLESQVSVLKQQLVDQQTHITSLEEELEYNRVSIEDTELYIFYLEEQSRWKDRQLSIPMLVGWRYSPDHGWLYTDKEVFPYVYRSDDGLWYHFTRDIKQVDTSWHEVSDRVFYNFETESYEYWR